MSIILKYLIVCPLVFLAGFVDAVAGGGGLISLPAYMLTGLPVHSVIGTNKLSSAMGATMATYRYGKSGYIKLQKAIPSLIAALIGSAIGAKLNLMVDEGAFLIIMLLVLPVAAWYVLKGKGITGEKPPFSQKKTIILCMLIAFVVGGYDGFYGPGTGTFLLLLLTGAARVSLTESAGITKVINLTSNITSLTIFLINGVVIIPLGLTAGLFSIAGNYIGTRFFAAKGAKSVKPVIIIVLSIFFIKLITEIASIYG